MENHKKGNVFLIGFMGVGKSRISACLQKIYGMKQIEMDEQIEKEQGMSISEIFRKKGEGYFRNLETEFLRRLSQTENMVVSCGGGAAMRRENVALMKGSGTVVLLTAMPETVYQRVKDSRNRPLLQGRMEVGAIRELMESRQETYEAAADLIIETDGKTAERICEELMEQLSCSSDGRNGDENV